MQSSHGKMWDFFNALCTTRAEKYFYLMHIQNLRNRVFFRNNGKQDSLCPKRDPRRDPKRDTKRDPKRNKESKEGQADLEGN